MSKIKYELFGGECEAVGYESDGTGVLDLKLPEECDGFISLDGVAVRLCRGEARVDLRYVSDGEHVPHVILRSGRIALPKIKKCGNSIALAECDADFIRRTSIRERRLAARVNALEEEIELLKKRIYGTKIF